MLLTYSITVSGKVHGVFFRQGTKEKALSLGIRGTVMNQPDGTVSIEATGTREQLEELLAWCRQGPPRARVEKLSFREIPLRHFEEFVILRFG